MRSFSAHQCSKETLAVCGIVLTAVMVNGAAAQSPPLRSGAEFTQHLQSTTAVSWTGVPLREALEILSRDQRIAVMLDRRVDPGQLVNFASERQSLEVLLRHIARHMDIGVCFVESVVYFGPPETAEKLPTVAAMRRNEAQQLPRDAALRFSHVRPWRWEMLATPRELLTELADETGAEIINLDQLPHDLWPAVELPPLSVTDRLTLVLAGFDSTYRFSPDGRRIELVPMPETAAIARAYPGKGHPRENADRIRRLFPEAEVTVEGEMIRVTGPWEAHAAIEELMQGKRVSRTVEPPQRGAGRTVYSLQVENEPVGGVIKALAERLNLQVTVAPEAEAKLTERVSFHVTDVSRDELFRAALQPAGLTFRATDDELRVLPSE